MPWDGPITPPPRLQRTPAGTPSRSGPRTRSRLRARLRLPSSRRDTPRTAPPRPAVWRTPRTSSLGTRSHSLSGGGARPLPRLPRSAALHLELRLLQLRPGVHLQRRLAEHTRLRARLVQPEPTLDAN